MKEIVAAWAPVLVLLAALAGSYVTRRNAKDTSVLGAWSTLAVELRTEASEAKKEAATSRTATRQLEERVDSLEDEERRKSQLARIHQSWDEWLVREMRICNPESTIPDPPPLD